MVAHGETTLVVDPDRVVEACAQLRDAEGFNVLIDISPVDYLGWGGTGVAGHIGTREGRDLNDVGSQGFQRVPDPKPKRFSVSYHLLRVGDEPARVRVQAWLDEGDELDSLVPVYPAADWYEREAFDMYGIGFRGHPNLVRILMPDDWEGHPLRKDFGVGRIPVQFKGAPPAR